MWRKKDKRKIYKTTDGFFTNRSDIKKKRRVAVVDQRKDDGALAVVKIYSKEGKSGNAYIDNLVLKPKKHPSLTKDSIVGKQVFIGTSKKSETGTTYKPIYERELEDTGDRLNVYEYKKIRKGISGNTPKIKAYRKKKMKKWHKHFKNK